MPKTAELGDTVSYFLPKDISHTFESSPQDRPLLEKGMAVFLENVKRYNPKYIKKMYDNLWNTEDKSGLIALDIQIKLTGTPGMKLTLATNESYELMVQSNHTNVYVVITAESYFGARHGLETLSQLIDYCEERRTLQVVSSAMITDSPAFPYRGILLDTSRNFISVETIMRTLDAMGTNKLNTFHWHITDSHSFPLVLKTLPNMAYFGSYSADKMYSHEDVRNIVEYGKVRGIRVLPEFDAPAHVGNGWEWGPQENLGNLAVCVNQVSSRAA